MKRNHVFPALLAMILLSFTALAERTQLKPGWNLFSKDQEVQLGRQAEAEAEKKLDIVRDPTLTEYINRLGKNLVRHAPDQSYPFTFKVVRDKRINAFALPGGPVYVNTGTIAAADNEAQLAGVMAHEISHIELRHSTNQASKAAFAQIGLGIFGAAAGGSVLGQLAQYGIGFGANTIFLKYSRNAESQADLMGTQIMYDSGYDADQLARFFQKLATEDRSRSLQFLSDHPDPGNRVEAVRREEQNLGGHHNALDQTGDFRRAKAIAVRLNSQSPSRPTGYMDTPSAEHQHATFPNGQISMYNGNGFQIGYPSNWSVYGQGTSALTLAPSNGFIRSGGGSALAYGAMISVFEADTDARENPSAATAQLIDQLRQSNPGLRLVSGRTSVRVAGRNGISETLLGRSPVAGQNEVDWLVAVPQTDGTLWYVIFVAPENDFRALRPSFEQMVESVQFAR